MSAPSPTRQEVYTTRRAFVLVLLLVFGYFSFRVFAPFVSYLFMGGLFVYLMHPLYRRTLRVVRRPSIAAGLMLVFFTVSLLGPLGWVALEVVDTTTSAVQGFDPQAVVRSTDDFLRTAYGWVGLDAGPDERSTTAELLNATLPALRARAEAWVPDLLTFAGNLVVGIIVMAFTIYYGLIDGPRFLEYVRTALPMESAQSRDLFAEIRRTVDAVFLGHIIVSVIQGVIGGIGFLLFGVPNAIFWGFVMILLSLIPVIGPPVVWIPAVVWLVATGNLFPAVGLLAWSALLVSTLDNVIRPRIIGTRADIHPLLILVGVLGGLAAFGFIGFVLGPLVIAILVAVLNFWRTDYLPRQMEPGAPPPPRPGGTPGLPPP